MREGTRLKILKDTLGNSYKSNSEYLFHCPKCQHHKRKLSLNLEKNVFKCWVCDWSGRDIYRIVRQYGSYINRQKWKDITNRVEIESFAEKIFGKENNAEETHTALPDEFISLANRHLPTTSLYPLNYLRSRGIMKQDVIRWKMGYCSEGKYAGRVIVPSFSLSGKVNFFIARTYINDWKKYTNSEVSKDIIFNQLYLDFDEDMTLVEGVFDAVIAGDNSVPILGSTLREESRLFQEIVKQDTPIYIALDADAEKKSMKIISNLLKYDIEVYKINVSPFSDVGEMSKKEFLKRKHAATQVNAENYLLNTINSI